MNQLLAGVHIATAAEAMALAAKAGADTRVVYEVISASAGNSWMFGNRVPHMLDDDYSPLSAVEIFVKDLGLVLNTVTNIGCRCRWRQRRTSSSLPRPAPAGGGR